MGGFILYASRGTITGPRSNRALISTASLPFSRCLRRDGAAAYGAATHAVLCAWSMLHALMDTFKNSSAPRQNIEALSPFPLARLLATLLEAIVEVACCRFVVALEISPRAAASTDLRPHDRDATSASSFSPANRRSCPGFEFFKHALLRPLSLYPSLPRNPSIDESTYAQN